MPYADFCSAVRSPYGHLSRRSDTEQISWGKFSHFPCIVAGSTLRTLMDVDFAVSRPLVRHSRLLSGFCPSTRTFVPCFFRTRLAAIALASDSRTVVVVDFGQGTASQGSVTLADCYRRVAGIHVS